MSKEPIGIRSNFLSYKMVDVTGIKTITSKMQIKERAKQLTQDITHYKSSLKWTKVRLDQAKKELKRVLKQQ